MLSQDQFSPRHVKHSVFDQFSFPVLSSWSVAWVEIDRNSETIRRKSPPEMVGPGDSEHTVHVPGKHHLQTFLKEFGPEKGRGALNDADHIDLCPDKQEKTRSRMRGNGSAYVMWKQHRRGFSLIASDVKLSKLKDFWFPNSLCRPIKHFENFNPVIWKP